MAEHRRVSIGHEKFQKVVASDIVKLANEFPDLCLSDKLYNLKKRAQLLYTLDSWDRLPVWRDIEAGCRLVKLRAQEEKEDNYWLEADKLGQEARNAIRELEG